MGTHYKVAHCPEAVVVSLSQWHLRFYAVLCLPTPHFMNIIRMRVMRTMGFLWSIALLMNRDESMLCDLDREGEAAMLERVRLYCVRQRGRVSVHLSVLYAHVQDISAKQ